MEDQNVTTAEVAPEQEHDHSQCEHSHDEGFAVTVAEVEEAMHDDLELTRSAGQRLTKLLNRKTELLRRFNAKVRRSRIRSKIARQSRKMNRGK